MGNILNKSGGRYRIINNECMIELDSVELRRQVEFLHDEVVMLKKCISMLEEKLGTDGYNSIEYMRLVQMDLEALVCNDKLLLEEIHKLQRQSATPSLIPTKLNKIKNSL